MISRTVPLAYLFVAMSLTSLFGNPSQLLAQQEKPDSAAADETKAGEQPDEAKPKRAKPRGRLPVYYTRVVSQEQRDQIYALQAKFQAEIDKLLSQLKLMEQQRDADIRKVLSPEQQKRVDALVAEAKLKREERRKPSAKTGDGEESTP